jgi:hypothetical protein
LALDRETHLAIHGETAWRLPFFKNRSRMSADRLALDQSYGTPSCALDADQRENLKNMHVAAKRPRKLPPLDEFNPAVAGSSGLIAGSASSRQRKVKDEKRHVQEMAGRAWMPDR